MQKPLQIANWEDGFEIAQSRRRAGRLSWVAMPTRHDSRGYRKLVRCSGDPIRGSQHLVAWLVMVQVAARCEVRGVLADDRGIALTCDDLEAMTDVPASIFEDAIPFLCSIGWLLCPESEHAQSTLGDGSEHGTSTVHNNTVQDNTKQNNTVSSSLVFVHKRDSDSNFNLIPKNRRRGISKWRIAWVNVIVNEAVDIKTAMDGILEYYESGEGQSEYYRQPATLLEDRIWEECQESWECKHAKKIDETTEKESFEKIFKGATDEND